MKLIHSKADQLVFHLSKREQSLLFDLIQLYPLIPETYPRVRREDGPQRVGDDQQLLEEALAEHRRENRRQIQALLAEPGRLTEGSGGCRLTLSPGQVEWLLQVLNDVRVGSWLAIGSPDEAKGRAAKVDDKNVHLLLALELCGLFQFALLQGLQGES